MKVMKFKFDLYRTHERLLDGAYANVEVEYDIDDISKNDFTDTNLVLKNISITDSYILNKPFNVQDIINAVNNYYDDRDFLIEDICEELSKEELNMVPM